MELSTWLQGRLDILRVSGTSSGGTGSRSGVDCTLHISSLFLLPSAFVILAGTQEESEHGQCPAALLLG